MKSRLFNKDQGESMIFNEFGGSKADTAVKLALIFFISLFSFSVGTFVGKQVSDTERRRAALEEDYGQERGVASDSHGHSEGQKDSHGDSLSKEDVEALTKEFMAAEGEHGNKKEDHGKSHDEAHKENHKKEAHHDDSHKKAEKHGYKKVDAHTEKEDSHAKEDHAKDPHAQKDHQKDGHKEAQHVEPVSKAADRVAHGKSPSPEKAHKRKPSSTLPKMPPTAIGKYTVQVSSYPTENEAKQHAKELKESGYSAFFIPAVVKGKTWYRVSIGLFDSYKSANYFRKELGKQSKMNSTIIQKIVK